MKKFLILGLLCFQLQASDIEELKQKLQQIPGFTTQFSQQVWDEEGNELQNSVGNMQVLQPNLFRWEVTTPDETLLVADGQSVWFYNPMLEQVTIYNQQQMEQGNPLLLLAQPNSERWSDYTVTKGKEGFTLTANSEQQIMSLTLVFRGEHISQLSIVDQQQQRTRFAFEKFAVNGEQDKQTFSFTVPKGVDVEDQR